MYKLSEQGAGISWGGWKQGNGQSGLAWLKVINSFGYISSVAGSDWWNYYLVNDIYCSSTLCDLTKVRPNPSLS